MAPFLLAGSRRSAQLALIALGVLAALALLLYLPFLGNPRVFDDLTLYVSRSLSERAALPFDSAARTLPYFTIAAVEVFFPEDQSVHRALSLVLHVAVGFALFALVRRVLDRVAPDVAEGRRMLAALVVAALFVAHPVAVYGAGYLIQRTIVFATLFSLVGITLLIDALARGEPRKLVLAALACSAAVFSKEHALPVAFVAAFAVPFLFERPGAHARAAALFLVLCMPATLWVAAGVLGLVGATYEPFAAEAMLALHGSPLFESPGGRWFASGVVQLGLFFRYLALWIAPDVSVMSIDMRVDFLDALTPGGIALRIAGFVACVAVALVALVRGAPRARAVAFGFLWMALLFSIELTSVRLQEPFVLYRSYLWAPGLAIAVAALATALPALPVALAGVAAATFLGFGAHERLASMRSDRTVWEDAGAKLARPDVPGAARVYFNRGLARVRAGSLDAAAGDFETIVRIAPRDYRGPFGLGAVAMRRGDPARALAFFDETGTLRKDIPDLGVFRGGALEALGRLDEAQAAYQSVADRGNLIAKMHVDRLKRARAQAGEAL